MKVVRFGVEVDLSREYKTGCPRCLKNGNDRNQDNLHVYGLDEGGKHGGYHCFACGHTYPSQEWLEENGEEEEEEYEDIMGKEFDEDIHQKIKERTGTDSKGYRGIRTDISRYFGVRYEYSEEDGSVAESLYPCTQDGKLVGYKRRVHPKQFVTPYGETGKGVDLFMQFRFKGGGRSIILCAGEVDALSAFQMMKDYNDGRNKGYADVPVVSSTIGESGSFRQVQNQYDFLNGYEKIIVCYDEDEAGKKAIDKVAKVVPKGKLFVMRLPLKDANLMLTSGRQREFVSAFFEAKPYVPVGVVGSGELLERIKESAIVPKVPLPPFMHKLQSMMAGGIPLGVVVNLGSASGTGKSTILDEIIYYLVFHSPHKVGVVSLESDSAQYGTKMLSRHIGRKIDLIEDVNEKLELLNSDYVAEKSKELFFKEDGSHRWMLVDERDGSLNDLKDTIMKLVLESDCLVVCIDPLQDILDGLTIEEQAVFMKWQKGMVKSHGVTFININHIRKSQGGGTANSTGAEIYEEDFQGSSAIFKSAACNLLFTRNKEAECEVERNTTKMKMTKCRWTGNTSPQAGTYYYDNLSHTLHDLEDWLEANPHMARLVEKED